MTSIINPVRVETSGLSEQKVKFSTRSERKRKFAQRALDLQPLFKICKSEIKKKRKLIETPVVISATKAPKHRKPFWNATSKNISEKLLSCTENDCYHHSSVQPTPACRGTAQKSWFTATQTNIDRLSTKNQSKADFNSICQGLDNAKLEMLDVRTEGQKRVFQPKDRKSKQKRKDGTPYDMSKPPASKAKRKRVYPVHDQEQLFLKWMGSARWTYNECLKHVELEHKRNPDKRPSLNKKLLRSLYVNEDALFGTKNAHHIETPYEIRDQAMTDLITAYKSNEAKKELHPDHTYEIRPRTRKDDQQSIALLPKCYSKFGVIYPTKWNKRANSSRPCNGKSTTEKTQTERPARPLKSSKKDPLPEKISYTSRLTRSRLGKWHLCIPEAIEPLARIPETQGESVKQEEIPYKKIIALDPGNRTFFTGYDLDGHIFEWGKGDAARLFRLGLHANGLRERMAIEVLRAKKRCRLRKAMLRINLKMRNLVAELHKKAVRWLTQSYDVVFLPTFCTQAMVARKQNEVRKINCTTARQMMTWSHYKFKERLLNKARETGAKVVICTEEYTTITCGECGEEAASFSGKTFRCVRCGQRSDRDFNASRNILLKCLTKAFDLAESTTKITVESASSNEGRL